MADRDEAARAAAMRRDWEDQELRHFLERRPEARAESRTASGLPVNRVYTPEDVRDTPFEEIGLPGRYPFTRGPYPTMYRGRLWTMRQIAGFGTGEDTNRRFHYLIGQGQTGLSVDFDMPTLMGYDSDDPHALGEVGREGVAVDTLEDLEALFDGIDLERISVSMTINPTAWILLAMYVALAEARGYDLNRLSGTVQADILKEYVAQKEWIFPIRPSLRIMRDMIVFCAERLARYNPINISGYHISEAGANSIQEVAFTMANAIAYVEEVTRSGVPVDRFAPRLAFYFVAQADFFEEVAKFRAARRVWAKLMRERFGARVPESMRLRFHCQTAAITLTKAQPMNNIVRTALQALSAVLGGAQSLHTNGLDEAFAIPSEEAMKVALRTQQIIAEESGVTETIDPLAGAHAIESLTDDIERRVGAELGKIGDLGGALVGIERGYQQRAIEDSAYEQQRAVEKGEKLVVGVNAYRAGEEPDVPILRVDEGVRTKQAERLADLRRQRDPTRTARARADLVTAARGDANLVPRILAAVEARVTLGEICADLREVFGTYDPPRR